MKVPKFIKEVAQKIRGIRLIHLRYRAGSEREHFPAR